ncbi:CGL77 [Auxenochlorella protothecoides x Auxenochlorella symbiontica]
MVISIRPIPDHQASSSQLPGHEGLKATSNDQQAWDALSGCSEAVSQCVVVDRSQWGRLRLVGPGALPLLQGQSTADVINLRPGQCCETVFVTATGRTVDLALVVVESEESVLLLLSPGMQGPVYDRLDRHIFPSDKVSVEDVTPATSMLSLLGPGALGIARSQGLVTGPDFEPGSSHASRWAGDRSVRVVRDPLLGRATPVVTLVCVGPLGDAMALLSGDQRCLPAGEGLLRAALLVAGRPLPGAELTPEANALEAGLYHAVSLGKGCYMGQETLSKVHSKGLVKQRLVGLEARGPVRAGDAVVVAAAGGETASLGGAGASGDAVSQSTAAPMTPPAASITSSVTPAPPARLGTVTSAGTTPAGRHLALAFLRTRAAQAAALEQGVGAGTDAGGPLGLRVVVDGVPAVVAPLAFPTWGFAPGAAPAPAPARAAAAAPAPADGGAEAERRAAKRAAAQAAIEAWQAQQRAAGQGP